jgi:hypothetical protein
MAVIDYPTPGTHFTNGLSTASQLNISNSTDPVAYNTRWQWNLTGAESTANAGSNLQFQGIADDGFTIINTPITINRATGAVTLLSGSITGNLTVTGSLTVTGNSSSAYALSSVGNALTAVGTNRATALQLAKQVNNVTTAASGTGVILPVGVIGMVVTVYNNGANAIKVYASASETVDTVAGATGVTLTNALRCQYTFVAANTWISAQLGVISA